MALPSPFNEVSELILWSGFEQGSATGQDSVLNATFTFGMFTTALQESRREIYRKTLRKENSDFSEDRADELKEAEKYLAIARLYPNYGSRMQLKFPESNQQSIGELSSGADTPDPYSKGRQLVEFMASQLRRIGLDLLEAKSNRWDIQVATYTQSDRFPCLSENAYSCCRTNTGGCYGC